MHIQGITRGRECHCQSVRTTQWAQRECALAVYRKKDTESTNQALDPRVVEEDLRIGLIEELLEFAVKK